MFSFRRSSLRDTMEKPRNTLAMEYSRVLKVFIHGVVNETSVIALPISVTLNTKNATNATLHSNNLNHSKASLAKRNGSKGWEVMLSISSSAFLMACFFLAFLKVSQARMRLLKRTRRVKIKLRRLKMKPPAVKKFIHAWSLSIGPRATVSVGQQDAQWPCRVCLRCWLSRQYPGVPSVALR